MRVAWSVIVVFSLLVAAEVRASSFDYSWETSTSDPGQSSQYDFYRMGDAGDVTGQYGQTALTSRSNGVVYNTKKQNTSLGFDVSASITINPSRNGDLPAGFAFVINGDPMGMDSLVSPVYPGQTPTNILGYEGITHSVAVEFDLYGDAMECMTPNQSDSHVGLSLTLDGSAISAGHALNDKVYLGTNTGNLLNNVPVDPSGFYQPYTLDLRAVYTGADDDRMFFYVNGLLVTTESTLWTMPESGYIGISGGGADSMMFPVSVLNSFSYSSSFVNPEPTTIAMLVLGSFTLLRRKTQ
jgi:hypothetical protein